MKWLENAEEVGEEVPVVGIEWLEFVGIAILRSKDIKPCPDLEGTFNRIIVR